MKWIDTDALYRMLDASIGKGVAPDWAYAENIAPVDYCARALVWLLLRKQTLGGAYHPVNQNPITWRELVGYSRANGFDVRERPYREWRALAGQEGDGLLGHWLEHVIGEEDVSLEDETRETGCERTVRALSGSGIECPRITEEIVGRYTKA
uniref:Uncharacterized protein n=1 Tax=Candidatus Kentrum sp. FW TaxID=2126338 RepID=A0A450TEV8_9GAMM|nr:MAG: hypothetical protein BECKFW1821A_GA0114235_12101 [Candidatus Kentron sp. FW]